jgi:Tfp pilus assembly protein PilF
VKARPAALTSAQAQRLLEVQRLLQQRTPAMAIPLARALVLEAPGAPDARHLLALALAADGQIGAAEVEFGLALQLAPGQPMILSNFARMLRGAGRHADALRLLRTLVRAAPSLAAGWIDLGLTLLALGDARAAREALVRATGLAPADAAAWHGLGSAARALHDLDAAAVALQRAQELAPASAPVQVNFGAVERLRGRPGDALVHYDRARALGLDTPELQNARTGVLLDAGRTDEAIDAARALVRALPDFVPGHVSLVNLLWEHGAQFAPGVDPFESLRAAVAAMPAHLALRFALARVLIDAKRESEALDLLARLPADAAENERLLLEADAFDRLGRIDAASERYGRLEQRGALREPDWIDAHVRHLLRARQPERAAAQAERALDIDPDHQASWASLATAWRLLDDPREYWLCDYERLCALIPVEGFAGDFPQLLELERSLLPLHRAAHEPMQQSLRGGSQTPGRLFGRDDVVLDRARSALMRAIESHLAQLPADPEHPFLRRRSRSVHLLGSWSVRLWSSGRHVDHIHHEGWISSAFYVALPPSMSETHSVSSDAGCLQLGRPPVELGLDLDARRILRPRAGHLALFPSYVWHGTVPFSDDAPRLTIAFDMQPRD